MKFLTIILTALLLESMALAADGLRFQCGNHSPSHSAVTLEEAQRFSRQNGCTNWDVLGLHHNDSDRKRLLDILNGTGNAANPRN